MLATSYSQIDTFLQCAHRWFRLYLLGERQKHEAEALNLGGAVHKTLENFFLNRKNGKTIEVGEAKEMLLHTMKDYNIPWLSQENKEIATEQHVTMITELAKNTNNLAKFMENKDVIACEKDFVFPIQLPFEILFNGQSFSTIYIFGSIDLIVKDPTGNLIAVDFKSGKKIFENKKITNNLQLPIYSLVIKQLYGRLPESTAYYFTRLDTFQYTKPLVKTEKEAEIIRFKSGKRKGEIKEKQKTITEIQEELIELFRLQYTAGMKAYKPNPSPLCSWCPCSAYDQDTCEHAMKYIRKDLPVPEKLKEYA